MEKYSIQLPLIKAKNLYAILVEKDIEAELTVILDNIGVITTSSEHMDQLNKIALIYNNNFVYKSVLNAILEIKKLQNKT